MWKSSLTLESPEILHEKIGYHYEGRRSLECNGTPLKMAMSPELENQLRQVFDVCDEGQTGSISISHLLNLAGEHFGTSSNVST